MTYELRSTTDSPLSADYERIVVIEGASQAAAVPKLLPYLRPNHAKGYNLSAGNTNLSLSLMRSGLLLAVNASSSTILIRTRTLMSLPAYNSSDPTEEWFDAQRRGTGALFINADTGVKIVTNDIATEFLAKYHIPVRCRYAGVDSTDSLETWFLG